MRGYFPAFLFSEYVTLPPGSHWLILTKGHQSHINQTQINTFLGCSCQPVHSRSRSYGPGWAPLAHQANCWLGYDVVIKMQAARIIGGIRSQMKVSWMSRNISLEKGEKCNSQASSNTEDLVLIFFGCTDYFWQDRVHGLSKPFWGRLYCKRIHKVCLWQAASNSCELAALVWKSFAWIDTRMPHCMCSQPDCISSYHHRVPRDTEELGFISDVKQICKSK